MAAIDVDTSFTLDNMGRYLCNALDEALASTGQTIAGRKRDFDVIVIGGGTFGSVIAQHLFSKDRTRSRRILVLEQGPFVLPEHVQNLPFLGGDPGFTRRWASDPNLGFTGLMYALGGRSLAWGGWSPELLKDALNDEMPTWPTSAVTDLRSRYFIESGDQIGVTSTNDFIFGPLHEAMRKQLFDALNAGSGPGGPFSTLKLADLPDHPIIRSFKADKINNPTGADPSDAKLREWLSLSSTDTTPRAALLNLLKLEAPLAVQARTEEGLFPFNKFSAIPLLTQAARIASTEADGTGVEADSRKRVCVVPKVHVQELITETQSDNFVRVIGVRAIDDTGAVREIFLAPPRDGGQSVVIIALGTIESTRVALTTFQQSLAGRAAQRMGQNLMAHLRSNLTIRVPREALTSLPPEPQLKALQVSALFVKSKANINGVDRYFHLQITASGLSKLGTGSEAELFKKVPTLDHLRLMLEADDKSVVITIRAIGEMVSHNPDSRIELAKFDFDFSRPAAWVTLGNAKAPTGGSAQTQNDRLLWNAMDAFSNQIALAFANGHPYEVLADKAGGKVIQRAANQPPIDDTRRDNLGTTHHEAGTLWMADNAADGVTNDFGRIHDTTNCYVAGPALFPTIGSPNPMLTGVALGRRTADLLISSVLPTAAPFVATAPWKALFDGTGTSFNQWTRVSPNNSNGFALINGEIVTYGTRDFGLLYYAAEAFADFTLRVQFRIFDLQNHNSGIFVRFRDPLLDLTPETLSSMVNESAREKSFRPDLSSDMELFQGNRAWSAVHSGFEIQIDDTAKGDPRKDFYGVPENQFDSSGGLRKNRTGAIYKIPAKDFIPQTGAFDAELQIYNPAPNLVPQIWYEFEIDVRGDTYTIDLTNLTDGVKTRTTTFVNVNPVRGIATANGQPAGYIGLQSYPGAQLAFRQIQIKP